MGDIDSTARTDSARLAHGVSQCAESCLSVLRQSQAPGSNMKSSREKSLGNNENRCFHGDVYFCSLFFFSFYVCFAKLCCTTNCGMSIDFPQSPSEIQDSILKSTAPFGPSKDSHRFQRFKCQVVQTQPKKSYSTLQKLGLDVCHGFLLVACAAFKASSKLRFIRFASDMSKNI